MPMLRPKEERHLAQVRTLEPIEDAQTYFSRLDLVLRSLDYERVEQITERLMQAYEEDRTVFLFGNGGSASLASHAACDLGKGTRLEGRRPLRVHALTDNIPTITAWANDASYEDIFSQQLRVFVRENDVVLAISGSGNSPNVVNGLRVARDANAYTIGLTGFQGGKMRELCDLCLVVPSDNMQFIEDLHVCISHSVFTLLRSRLSYINPAAKAITTRAA